MDSMYRLKFQVLRWSMYLLLAIAYILVYFHRMAPGVISEDLMAAFNTSGASLGTLSAIYFFTYFIMQIPAGVLVDTIGTRITVTSGCFVSGIGSLLFSYAGSFATAVTGRLLVGLGVSVIFISIMKFNSMWYREHRFAIMSGVTLLIGNMGSIMAAGPLSLILKTYSWREIFFKAGLLSLVLAVIAYALIRNRPEQVKLLHYHHTTGDSHKNGTGNHWMDDLKEVLSNISLWPGFWINFGMVGSIYTFMGLWGVPYLRDIFGMTRNTASGYITVLMITFSIGGLFFGWLSDRIGQRKSVLVASMFAYLASWLILMYVPWRPGLSGYLVFALLGFTPTGSILVFASAKEITNPYLAGMSTSLVNTGTFIGTLILQPLFGYVMDKTWDGTLNGDILVYSTVCYRNGFILIVVFSFIGIVASFRIKETYCKNIYKRV